MHFSRDAKLESVLLEYILDIYAGDSLHKIGVLQTRRVYIASNIITAISFQVTSRIFLPIPILQCPECAPTREKSLGSKYGSSFESRGGVRGAQPSPRSAPPSSFTSKYGSVNEQVLALS